MKHKTKKSKAREIALKILYGREFNKENKNCKKELSGLSKTTRAHVSRLLKGVEQYRGEIDRQIKQSSKSWKMERISLIDLNIMRIALYEMLYATPPVPFKVCIDESVEMAKIYGAEDSFRFVNGHLDDISKRFPHTRNKQLLAPLQEPKTITPAVGEK